MNNITQQISQWIENEDCFCDLILTPDGNLCFDENMETCADWFALYCNGQICIRPSGNLYCFGSLPDSYMIFPIHVEDTAISSVKDCGCFVSSNFPDLDTDISAFAIFQYGDVIGSYTADTTHSDKILFRMDANTPQNKDQAVRVFFTQLNHYNPWLCKNIEAWLRGHGASWKGDE